MIPLQVPTIFYDLLAKKPILFKKINNVDTFTEYFFYNNIPYRVQVKYSYLSDYVNEDIMIFFVYDRRYHAKIPTQIHSLIEEIIKDVNSEIQPYLRSMKMKDL